MSNVTTSAAVINAPKVSFADLKSKLTAPGSAPAAAKAASNEIPWGESHPQYKEMGKEKLQCPVTGKEVSAKFYGEHLLRNYPNTGVTLKTLMQGYQELIAEQAAEIEQLKAAIAKPVPVKK